ncbi:MAG: hypothetical protein D6800_09785 [Candidatus Zixiibacteriota bacterium]|nr:MAG: hypothetical protein D6800_09785 [candidate division Zixibacteria bacterium]
MKRIAILLVLGIALLMTGCTVKVPYNFTYTGNVISDLPLAGQPVQTETVVINHKGEVIHTVHAQGLAKVLEDAARKNGLNVAPTDDLKVKMTTTFPDWHGPYSFKPLALRELARAFVPFGGVFMDEHYRLQTIFNVDFELIRNGTTVVTKHYEVNEEKKVAVPPTNDGTRQMLTEVINLWESNRDKTIESFFASLKELPPDKVALLTQ